MLEGKLFKNRRVFYKKCQLESVTFQINFNPILSIETDFPAEFQKEIINEFPFYSEYIETRQIQIDDNIKFPLKQIDSKKHVFHSKDKQTILSLSSSYLSISVNRYEKFEKFLDPILYVSKIFYRIYNPIYFTRIGLRYIDLFRRSKLGLENSSWNELIKDEYLGFYKNIKNDELKRMRNEYLIEINENSVVRILTGFVYTKAEQLNEKPELCFLLDSDFFYKHEFGLEDLNDKLSFLHNNSIGLVAEVVTEKLNDKMEPEDC